MDPPQLAALAVAVLLALRWIAQVALERLNLRHVRAHADAVPEAYRESIDADTYARAVRYTLDKGRFSQIEDTVQTGLLVLVLYSGMLPWVYAWWGGHLGASTWSVALFLLGVLLGLSVLTAPLDWYAQFRLEQRHGFNTMTLRTWCLDRVKALPLVLGLGLPLLALVLKLVDWAGAYWWVWAWIVLLAFQFLLTLLAPALILPLFNKFTPLPEGTLRERLFALAGRTSFHARSIHVMDGSKRSRHSNAFFTGFGRSRRIVLFDTLIDQLTEPELEAVLAHEIGHYRLRHILKMLAASAAASFLGFAAIGWLAGVPWFNQAFGFEPADPGPTLLLALLAGGAVSFWASPLLSRWSRRFEYEADAFAARAIGDQGPLVGALRRLTERNLSNLAPHPQFSSFYYSHPTLPERESALRRLAM